jgi:hypothetical protein
MRTATFQLACPDRLSLIRDIETILEAEKQAYADELANPGMQLSVLYVRDLENYKEWIEDQTVLAILDPLITAVRVVQLRANI